MKKKSEIKTPQTLLATGEHEEKPALPRKPGIIKGVGNPTVKVTGPGAKAAASLLLMLAMVGSLFAQPGIIAQPGTQASVFTNRLMTTIAGSGTTNRIYYTNAAVPFGAFGNTNAIHIRTNAGTGKWEWRTAWATLVATNDLNRPTGTWHAAASGAALYGYTRYEPRSPQTLPDAPSSATVTSFPIMVDTNGVVISPTNFFDANEESFPSGTFSGSGDDITSGTVAAEFVDAAITRDNEVPRVMSTNAIVVGNFEKPMITFDTWSSFQSTLQLDPYSTNAAAWVTNLAAQLFTNGIAAAVQPAIWIDDGWQAAARDGSGDLTWNTEVFPNLTNTIKEVHAKQCLVFLYTSHATNTCGGLPGSPTNVMYRDITKMLTWGADGVFIDTCQQLSVVNDDNFLAFNLAEAHRAVSDYNLAVYSTQGVVRPFYISTATGNGADSPGTQNITRSHFNYCQSLSWNWRQQGTGDHYKTWVNALDALEFFGRFTRPGFTPDMCRVYDAQNGAAGQKWEHEFSAHAMVSAQMRTGAGDTRVCTWTNAAYAGGYGEGYEIYQMTNVFLRYLSNADLLYIWRDNVRSPRIVWTNDLTQLWVKDLNNGGRAAWLVNLASTSYVATVRVQDLGVFGTLKYKNVFTNSDSSYFSSSFSTTVGSSNSLLYLITPDTRQTEREEARSWQEVTVTGTGVSIQTSASPMGTPWFAQDGIYQANANNFWQFTMEVPVWATSVQLRYLVLSDFAGDVAWTNTVGRYYWGPTGRASFGTYTAPGIVTSSGVASWYTNAFTMPETNSPKELIVTFGASSNTSPRRVVGGIHALFQ